MKGGTFMRVRVSVDVSRPLCRGKKVSFDENKEGGSLSSMKGYQIYVSGVGCCRMMIRTVSYS